MVSPSETRREPIPGAGCGIHAAYGFFQVIPTGQQAYAASKHRQDAEGSGSRFGLRCVQSRNEQASTPAGLRQNGTASGS